MWISSEASMPVPTRPLALLALLALAGCPRPAPPEPFDYGETPHLPAPSAGTYAQLIAPPPDPA